MTSDEQEPEQGEDQGLSLDKLSATFAEALGQPAPFQQPVEEPRGEESTDEAIARLTEQQEGDDPCEVSPTTILEALLFVGSQSNDLLSAEKAASVMRGVKPDEVDDLVAELNARYESEGCPYEVVVVGSTYRMTLKDAFRRLRDKFYGKVREAKLSQPAIDVLALVAYHQGCTRDEVDTMRGKPSGPILNQLVRRRLLRMHLDPDDKRIRRYSTTPRFLQTFGLTTLDDLPQPQAWDE